MAFYEESKDWCVEYAKTHGFKYFYANDDGEKYFRDKKEAQMYFDALIEYVNEENNTKYTRATLMYKSNGEFTEVTVSYS